jgi:hypothetical protein
MQVAATNISVMEVTGSNIRIPNISMSGCDIKVTSTLDQMLAGKTMNVWKEKDELF